MTNFNTKPTALMIGRFQPFHDGHRALFEKALELTGHVLIGVRNTHTPGDEENPLDYFNVKKMIEAKLADYTGQFDVVLFPNITNVVYGRGVGYELNEIRLDEATEGISATKIRSETAFTDSIRAGLLSEQERSVLTALCYGPVEDCRAMVPESVLEGLAEKGYVTRSNGETYFTDKGRKVAVHLPNALPKRKGGTTP